VTEAPDPVTVALEVGAILDRLGVAWVIGGSFASSVYGEPRSTQDVDVVAALKPSHVKPLGAALKRDYYASDDAMRDATATGGGFNAIHVASGFKVDIYVAGDDAFDAERLSKRQAVTVDGGTLYVDTAEHVLLRKLEWYRRGGEVSERQWRDVQAIVRIQGTRLESVRLKLWAERLGVTDLLERLLHP
jgi:hypothetical protein